ncbi:MAG: hypothetical protein ACOXZ0_08335 [Eubacteriales bacterium]|jgi:hypothetical protein
MINRKDEKILELRSVRCWLNSKVGRELKAHDAYMKMIVDGLIDEKIKHLNVTCYEIENAIKYCPKCGAELGEERYQEL